jgi:epoxyqueuosine reductase
MTGALSSFAAREAVTAPSLTARVLAFARHLGFEAVGVARANVALEEDIKRYDAFVANGMHGEMTWLAKHREAKERLDGESVLLGAKSVICLARSYRRPRESEASDPETAQLLARYARGRDYHKFLRRKIRRLAAFLRSLGSNEAPVRARPLCDDAPVLERAWAARAGLGFVGKNGLLIVPGVGSMVLLGEVVTTLDLAPNDAMGERCGSCTRCLDACPTQAFVAPFVLDARRCIAYLTIEHRGSIPEEHRSSLGTRIFGCDDCQTVCPFNASSNVRSRPVTDDPFAPLERWSQVRLHEFAGMDDAAWDALSNGSPLRRAGRVGLARNAAIALGNRKEAAALQVVRRVADEHDSATVREAAAWAASRIERGPSS